MCLCTAKRGEWVFRDKVPSSRRGRGFSVSGGECGDLKIWLAWMCMWPPSLGVCVCGNNDCPFCVRDGRKLKASSTFPVAVGIIALHSTMQAEAYRAIYELPAN